MFINSDKRVLIIGSGVSGLSAAIPLARLGIQVEVIEKNLEVGGHSRQLACKATDRCVTCGACIVEEKIKIAHAHPKIKIHFSCTVEKVEKDDRFLVHLLDDRGSKIQKSVDAIIIASGCTPYNPESEPYGYHIFKNVITNLDLERMLRNYGQVTRPSDEKIPERMVFIQCVGSRDATLGHLWCSKVCCGSALRMAKLIKSKHPEMDITFFYRDIQNFSKNFQAVYEDMIQNFQMLRIIPGDIFNMDGDNLRITYFKDDEEKTREELFDLVILSVGLIPGHDNARLAEMFKIPLQDTGFFSTDNQHHGPQNQAIFPSGATNGPMGIAEAVADAGRTTYKVLRFLKENSHSS